MPVQGIDCKQRVLLVCSALTVADEGFLDCLLLPAAACYCLLFHVP